jgi:microcystin-dependent protein
MINNRIVSLTTTNNSKLAVSQGTVTDSVYVSNMNVTEDVYINNYIYTPVGSILSYAGVSAPGGWLLCDGSEVSKTDYPRLFAVVGTMYGTASNGSNFVLPNLADRVPVGKSNTNSVGNSGGNSSVTLSVLQLPSHTHTGTSDVSGIHVHSGTTDANGSHTHTITDPGHAHTQTTINDDFNNSGGSPPGFAADSAGSRTWSNINSATTDISINSAGSHTHSFTTGSSGNHSHTFTTNATGSGNSIDIRNKYVVINYIIRY